MNGSASVKGRERKGKGEEPITLTDDLLVCGCSFLPRPHEK